MSCAQRPDGSGLEEAVVLETDREREPRGEPAQDADLEIADPMIPPPKGEHRLYDSTAFLADDRSVISMSSNSKGQAGAKPCLRFEPLNLFKGPRSSLSGVPDETTDGQTDSITRAAM